MPKTDNGASLTIFFFVRDSFSPPSFYERVGMESVNVALTNGQTFDLTTLISAFSD